MSFLYPQWLLLLLLLAPVFFLAARRRQYLGFSRVSIQKNLAAGSIIGWLPAIFLSLFWIALCLSLARPQLEQSIERPTIDTRDFIIATDISDSMNWGLVDPADKGFAAGEGGKGNIAGAPGIPAILLGGRPSVKVTRRITVAQKATAAFIDRRQGDRIALILFDHKAYFSWPLSRDLKVIALKMSGIERYIGDGTNFDGPSAASPLIGPLQAALNHFKEESTARSKVLILVTDGEERISPPRFRELAASIKSAGIKMYVLGIGSDWSNNALTEDLRRFSAEIGGTVIPVSNVPEMGAAFDQIDQLEKSAVQIETVVNNVDVYQWFLLFSTLSGVIYLALSALMAEEP